MQDSLFLFRGGDVPGASPEEIQKQMEKWGRWIRGLAHAGKFKAGNPLENTGKTLSGAKRLVTDGPYLESKEMVGGYLIVQASSETDATEMAKGCPIFETGGEQLLGFFRI